MAARMAIERYMKEEKMLFVQNADGTILETGEGMEIFFPERKEVTLEHSSCQCYRIYR